ncbi:putative ubiquitin carboxyl-terminal hydrolase 1 [Podospora fimiseda]|uniref:Ubiquitin carboxyl-terminal hydrolase n=1 Tax=Podospora fimiseda TaxID=252190 RepID=A0AAN7BLV2_9PEZI|nr:putative ubiquitin carboxyl-terminal hydrolase 1 [Podospora fimiseda]
MLYRKHFIPLESNPDIFNELMQRLVASNHLRFEEVYTLDDPQALPRPALAAILVIPTTPRFEAKKAVLESTKVDYTGKGDNEPVVWFKQTINNACGLYSLLHALSNGRARQLLSPRVLEDPTELEEAYAAVASKGNSAVPENAQNEVDFHYICLTSSGDSKGPVSQDVELNPAGDVLRPNGLASIRALIDDHEDGSIGFNLMVLIQDENIWHSDKP